MKSEIPTLYFQNYPWWQVIRCYAKWCMVRCHFVAMVIRILVKCNRIWNFHLSLARQWRRLIFRWIENGGALVAQNWTVSLLKNPIEPPRLLYCLVSSLTWRKTVQVKLTNLRGDGYQVVVVRHSVVLQDVYNMTWSRFPERCRFVICEKNKGTSFLCLLFELTLCCVCELLFWVTLFVLVQLTGKTRIKFDGVLVL